MFTASGCWVPAQLFYLAVLLITHILIALFALGFAEYAAALVPA